MEDSGRFGLAEILSVLFFPFREATPVTAHRRDPAHLGGRQKAQDDGAKQ